MLGDQLEGGRRKVGFNTDARHNLKFHTRKQDHIEKGEAIGLGMQIYPQEGHAHLNGQQKGGTLWRLLRRIPRLKFVNSGVVFTNHAIPWTGVARDRRPGPVAPCRTSTTGYTLG